MTTSSAEKWEVKKGILFVKGEMAPVRASVVRAVLGRLGLGAACEGAVSDPVARLMIRLERALSLAELEDAIRPVA